MIAKMVNVVCVLVLCALPFRVIWAQAPDFSHLTQTALQSEIRDDLAFH